MGERLIRRRPLGVVDNRPAFFGGVAGTLLTGAALYFALGIEGSSAYAHDDEALPFAPATLVSLGTPDGGASQPAPQEPPTPTPPEPTPIDPEPTVEPTPDAVTTSPKPRPRPTVTSSHPKPRPKPTPPGSGSKPDPFGATTGLRELDRAGDPWAAAILEALRRLPVRTFEGQAAGNVKFQLVVCKNGTIDRVKSKGGSADAALRASVLSAAERVRLPPAPSHIRKLMRRDCQLIGHTFRWQAPS